MAQRKTGMGLFVILEVLFSLGARVFQSRPPQRKKSKTLLFFRHLRIPFNFRKCFPSSGQQKHPRALGPFLACSHHPISFPSPTESCCQKHPRSLITWLCVWRIKGLESSFLLIFPTYFLVASSHRKSVSKESGCQIWMWAWNQISA